MFALEDTHLTIVEHSVLTETSVVERYPENKTDVGAMHSVKTVLGLTGNIIFIVPGDWIKLFLR